MKNEEFFNLLQHLQNQIPQELWKTSAINFDVAGHAVSSNIEVLYARAVHRLTSLSYGLMWRHTLNDSTIKPSRPDTGLVMNLFPNVEEMEGVDITKSNKAFGDWVANQTLRDLSEYLLYYLLEIYELCLTVKLSKEDIKFNSLKDIKEKSEKFEKNSLSDRLKTLHKEFGIITPNKDALQNLYKLRNVFAHFDGIMQKKYCDDKGIFQAYWPVNSYYLHKRVSGKKVPYHKVRKPFTGDEYGKFEVCWLKSSQKKKYKAGEKIDIDDDRLHSLIFFYLYIFQELQKGMIKFMKKHGIKVNEFDTYGGTFSLVMSSDDQPPQAT